MNDPYSPASRIEFLAPIDIEVGMVVWIRWDHYRHGDTPPSATPTTVIKIYDDGNILHERRGYDTTEFAWAKDIIAKSHHIDIDRLPFRTVKIIEIREAIMENSEKEVNYA